ncbi:biotin carboxylase N-terminal domain-containing protein [Streptomyces sp. NPDC004126]|uniref:ATP-binding protein n=1 Tax=Streptomyces sp. NPDC004126 TaxID=3390695 RepID=UPI003D0555AD
MTRPDFRPLRHVLVANRAAIAVRAAETCRAMGLVSTVLTAASDPQDRHAEAGDHRFSVGGWGMRDTYDSVDRVVEAALRSGADTVYPGYGALAEDPELPERLAAAGLRFVGPSAGALRSVADKQRAIEVAERHGVPVLPHHTDHTRAGLAAFAERTGWPVILKPAAGYGGQGVRIVHTPAELAALVPGAAGADGGPRWYAEQFRADCRVVGISLAIDVYGTVAELGERETLLSADGLKLLEAAPVLGVPAGLVGRMRADAGRLALAFGLTNVVTVEFLVDGDDYFFMEVNGRLPLAYRMSESQCGLDVIALQLRIAADEPITPGTVRVDRTTHALEARLFVHPAELSEFPRVGRLERLSFRPVAGVSYAHTVDAGRPVWYELILAQALATGSRREEAGARLAAALEAGEAAGIRHYAQDIADALDTRVLRPAAC